MNYNGIFRQDRKKERITMGFFGGTGKKGRLPWDFLGEENRKEGKYGGLDQDKPVATSRLGE